MAEWERRQTPHEQARQDPSSGAVSRPWYKNTRVLVTILLFTVLIAYSSEIDAFVSGFEEGFSESVTPALDSLDGEAQFAEPVPSDTTISAGGVTETNRGEIQLSAKQVSWKPSPIASGRPMTTVRVVIRNNSDEPLKVNPLYFWVVDRSGEKHASETGEDERQIDVVTLLPGEKARGVIAGEGRFDPEYVTFERRGLGLPELRAKVDR